MWLPWHRAELPNISEDEARRHCAPLPDSHPSAVGVVWASGEPRPELCPDVLREFRDADHRELQSA